HDRVHQPHFTSGSARAARRAARPLQAGERAEMKTVDQPSKEAARPEQNRDFVTSLAKGLAVIQAFGPQAPRMTLSEVALATDLSRAGARRLLLTLEELGFVARNGRSFELTPKILQLGFAFLAS